MFNDAYTAAKALCAYRGISDPDAMQLGAAMYEAEFMSSVILFIDGMRGEQHQNLSTATASPKERIAALGGLAKLPEFIVQDILRSERFS